jgi:CDP-diacylglycerol--glycerol-3-phosphate 3-phosphatidyltransferase
MRSPDERAAAFLSGITYLRIVLAPVVMALVMVGDREPWAYPTAAVLFGVAAVTDYFDGRLARRWKQTTTLGAFLDTTADKLLVSGALLALVAVDRASPWVAFVIIGRELLIMGLRGAVSAADGVVVTPSMWGKWKATVQFVAIGAAILRPDVMVGSWFLDQVLMAIAALLTIVSAFQYLARFVAVLSHRGERRLARRRATGAAGPTGASGTSDATGATAPRRDDPATTR